MIQIIENTGKSDVTHRVVNHPNIGNVNALAITFLNIQSKGDILAAIKHLKDACNKLPEYIDKDVKKSDLGIMEYLNDSGDGSHCLVKTEGNLNYLCGSGDEKYCNHIQKEYYNDKGIFGLKVVLGKEVQEMINGGADFRYG